MGWLRRLGKSFFKAASGAVGETLERNERPMPEGATGQLTGWSNIWPTKPMPTLPGSLTLQQHKDLMGSTNLGANRQFFRSAWQLMKPYWLTRRGMKGWLLFATTLGLSSADVYLAVQSSNLNQEFINNVVQAGTKTLDMATRSSSQDAAWGAFATWLGVIAMQVATSVYFTYVQNKLAIDWRKAMTSDLIDKWMSNQTVHRLRSIYNRVDNPEQRIEGDVSTVTGRLVDVPLGLINAAQTITAFSAVLWNLSKEINFEIGDWNFTSDFHFSMAEKSLGFPGYLFVTALIYAAAGTAATHYIGKKLIDLSRQQEQVNADFRASMARAREYAEGIVFFGGEEEEKKKLKAKFQPVMENWEEYISRTKKLGWFKSYYAQAADLFPFLVAAPAVMSGTINYGQLIQTRIGFSQVNYGLTWFIAAYDTLLAPLVAATQRLTTFNNDMDQSKADFLRTNLSAVKEDDKTPPAPPPPAPGL